MKSTPITDREVEALLTGHVPPGRPELDELADLLAGLRQATLPPPTPSSELAAWMQGHRPSPTTTATPRHARRRLAAWIAGLSIGAQVALGTTVAAAALTGAGIADVLPEVMQRPFDDVRDHLGLLDQTDSTPTPAPVPSEDAPPAQDTTETENDVKVEKPIRPVPASTTRPDLAPGPQRDGSADTTDPEATDPAPGTDETSDAEAQEPDASDEPAETDREEDQTPEATDDDGIEDGDLTNNADPHETGGPTDTLVEGTHDAGGDDAETGAPATDEPTMDGVKDAAAADPAANSGERSDIAQDE